MDLRTEDVKDAKDVINDGNGNVKDLLDGKLLKVSKRALSNKNNEKGEFSIPEITENGKDAKDVINAENGILKRDGKSPTSSKRAHFINNNEKGGYYIPDIKSDVKDAKDVINGGSGNVKDSRDGKSPKGSRRAHFIKNNEKGEFSIPEIIIEPSTDDDAEGQVTLRRKGPKLSRARDDGPEEEYRYMELIAPSETIRRKKLIGSENLISDCVSGI